MTATFTVDLFYVALRFLPSARRLRETVPFKPDIIAYPQ